MKKITQLTVISLIAGLTGCVSVRSNSNTDAVPPVFNRVLVVTKLRNAPDTYVQQFATSFPSGYEVCTLALSPLSFENPDEAIRKRVAECHSDVILTLDLVKTGFNVYKGANQPYQFDASMKSAATGQPFWKAIISSSTAYDEEVPPNAILKQLLKDNIIHGKLNRVPAEHYSASH